MDLGSGIRKKPIRDPGSRGQKGTGSWIRIRNTGTDCGTVQTVLLWDVRFHIPALPAPWQSFSYKWGAAG
jgi:hypothetical protein